jgi:hypothetical protein
LLGFDHLDRDAPRLSTIFAEGISEADLDAAEMYKPGAHPDLKTTHLKPYFYVLNNLIRYTIDPKFGDSIHLRQDAPKILARFGANGGRFGVSDFMWNKIADASVDPNKYLPYAPYLMHIIEQVTGMQFSHPCIHAPVCAKHLGAPHAPPLSPAGAATPGAATPGFVTPAGAADAQGEAIPPQDSGRGRRSPTRHALQRFFSYFCYCQKKTDQRLHRLEEKAALPPSSPLREFQDPYADYDNMHRPSVDEDEEQQDPPSAFDPFYGGGIPAGFSMEDTEAGFAYQDIFGAADNVTRASVSVAPPHEQSTSADPHGKGPLRTFIDYSDDDDDDDLGGGDE